MMEPIESEVRARESSDEAASRSRLPRLELRALATQYGLISPIGFEQLMGSPTAKAPSRTVTDWVVGAHISFPLFDGGQRRGQIEQAHAQLLEARLTQQHVQLRVSQEVRTAMADLESAESRVKSLHDSVSESERVLHDEKVKFEAGRSVINFVLDAESALLMNQSLLSQAQRSAAIAGFELDLSVGRISLDHFPN